VSNGHKPAPIPCSSNVSSPSRPRVGVFLLLIFVGCASKRMVALCYNRAQYLIAGEVCRLCPQAMIVAEKIRCLNRRCYISVLLLECCLTSSVEFEGYDGRERGGRTQSFVGEAHAGRIPIRGPLRRLGNMAQPCYIYTV